MHPSDYLNILSCFKHFDPNYAKLFTNQFTSIPRLSSYSLSFIFVCKELPDQDIQDVLNDHVQKIQQNDPKKKHQVSFFSDSSFLGDELYDSVMTYKYLYESNHLHSFGWLMQQIIKLYSPLKFETDILIFDADSLPLRYLPTFDNSLVLPSFIESNDLYFELNSFLLGELIAEHHLGCTSYIAQHMFFDFHYMKLLAKFITNESNFFSCKHNFIHEICKISSSSTNYLLSEYELYGSFVHSLEINTVERISIRLARHGTILRSLLGHRISMKVYQMLDCDIVAYELWSKKYHILEVFKLTLVKFKSFFGLK